MEVASETSCRPYVWENGQCWRQYSCNNITESNGEANISHENTTTVVWIYDGVYMTDIYLTISLMCVIFQFLCRSSKFNYFLEVFAPDICMHSFPNPFYCPEFHFQTHLGYLHINHRDFMQCSKWRAWIQRQGQRSFFFYRSPWTADFTQYCAQWEPGILSPVLQQPER